MTNALALVPMDSLERMAQAVSASKLFGITNQDQALALMLVAQAEGLHPATAARDYHIIQGRPALKADAMLARYLASGGTVEWLHHDDTKVEAKFSHPAGGTLSIAWDMDRAKKAGLGGKDMWTKYPRQMLRARCVSEGVRTVFPMATSGMYVPEEVQDIVAEEARPAPPQAAHEPIQSALPAPAGLKRLTSARAKEIWLDKQLKDAIWGTTDPSELAEWDA